MLHLLELDLIHFIQRFRNPVFDEVFIWLDFFDRPAFFFILIPTIWLIYGSKTGARLFYLLMSSAFINHTLKQLFLSPRPFTLDPSVGIIHVGGYGFPSGAAQTVILLSMLFLSSSKSNGRYFLAFSYVFLVSFSRVYLGIHFPSDILGGWLVGFALWTLYKHVYPLLENLRPVILFLMSQLVIIPVFILQHFISPIYICNIGIAMGLFISYYYKLPWRPPLGYKERMLSAGIGILGALFSYGPVLIFSISCSKICFFLGNFLSGLWVSLGAPFICFKIFTLKKMKNA
ncbi:MAG: phosphatase PAP2 family protein [Chlamydiales bacterium]|jgi:membrane-associated phospholipid phosphatase|nr:phosphatase PAP2 family protein [Chlamydiales bacterium]